MQILDTKVVSELRVRIRSRILTPHDAPVESANSRSSRMSEFHRSVG